MTDDLSIAKLSAAADDFRRMRRQADIELLLGRVWPDERPNDLLSFDDVSEMLRAKAIGGRRLEEIPLDAIIGSVGRYSDFTRSFLPRRNSDQERWTRVLLASERGVGLPPIEVYQIGEAYFVADGNHRVSVARLHGSKNIQAYVTRFATRVSLEPNITPEQLIIRAEYHQFLEQTRLDELRPGADLLVTAAGQYPILLEHIQVHHYFRELDDQRKVSLEDAVASWYDRVYLPIVALINERGLLRDFPGRTEADLYVWMAQHRAALAQQLGWAISDTTVIRAIRNKAHGLEAVRETIAADFGPPPGRWRHEQAAVGRGKRLFRDLLVALSGDEDSWEALDQAIFIAQHEGGRIYGLHVTDPESDPKPDQIEAIGAELRRRCVKAGIPGSLATEPGPISKAIYDRSRWADLVVLRTSFPPQPTPLARLKSGLRTLIRRSICPVLCLPSAARSIERAVIAYDGSPKAHEALFVAAYLVASHGIHLDVLAIDERGSNATNAIDKARAYLDEREIEAAFHRSYGPVGPVLTEFAERCNNDLIIMGGYGFGPVTDLVVGSAVEEVLRAGSLPVLICQ